MGSFTRNGNFKDRGKFIAALKTKLVDLQAGTLRGSSLEWEGEDKATLSLMGATVAFKVGDGNWSCDANLPAWIPIPQKTIEEKFDREFEGLKGM